MFNSIYADKKILITGHTGFKGSWLSAWLHRLGAKIVGISDCVPTEPSNFAASGVEQFVEDIRLDVRDTAAVRAAIEKHQPDVVFHLAAQALVRPAYETPVETMATNAMGTANVLDALRFLGREVVAVMITSDKAYDNVEWAWGYRETDALGGKDPYSASKGMAELAIKTYFESYFADPDSRVRLGIGRAGNVIGGGDWSKDRLVPDCMKSWSMNETVDIRGPHATRPWQHVLEPLSGYLALGAELLERPHQNGEAFNFGPPARQNHSVSRLIDEMALHWDNVSWNDVSQDTQHVHEAGLLKLNCDKALHHLGWLPTLEFEQTVKMTVDWYSRYYRSKGADMLDFTSEQIDDYVGLAIERGLIWAK